MQIQRKFITFFGFWVIISFLMHVAMLFGLTGIRGLSLLNIQDDNVINVIIKGSESKIIKRTSPSNSRAIVNQTPDKTKNNGEDQNKNIESAENNNSESSDSKIQDNTNNLQGTENPSIDSINKYSGVNITPANFEMFTKEKLSYVIYWYGIYAGNAVLESENKNGILKITSTVYSSPFVSAFYRVEDFAECIITNGYPLKLRLKTKEGSHTSDKETLFDIKAGKVTFINYLKGKSKEYNLPDGPVWDILSGFFYLRTHQLDISKQYYIDIFDSNKFYRTEVDILKRENIQNPAMGEISTLVIKPVLKSEGLFKKTGDIYIWLTDDMRKIPVRIETKIPVGNIVAELKEIQIN
jgi:hypothetical protein